MRAPSYRLAPALGMLIAAAAAAGAIRTAPPEAASRGGQPAEAQIARLRTELELARSGSFYLRLDARRQRLELCLRGVALESFETLALEQGTPRVAFLRRDGPETWDRVAYRGGQLEPTRERDRIEVLAPSGAPGVEPAPPPIPATAEESVSVPARWRVVFAEGLSLEVRSGGARNRGRLRRLADALSLWRTDVRRATSQEATKRVWLRVRLAPEDAASLYRSLPPDVGLVVAADAE